MVEPGDGFAHFGRSLHGVVGGWDRVLELRFGEFATAARFDGDARVVAVEIVDFVECRLGNGGSELDERVAIVSDLRSGEYRGEVGADLRS